MRATILLSAILLVSGCIGAAADTASGDHSTGAASLAVQDAGAIRREFNVGAGKRLDIDLKSGGSIEITGESTDTVSVAATIGGRNAADIQVDINQTAEGVEVRSRHVGPERRHYSTNVRLEIKVPSRFDVLIDTMGGAVTITNVEGDIRGKTMGGALNLSNLKGELNLSTMGGNITLKQSNVNGKVSTMGGEVLVEDVTGDVKGSSMGGKVQYKNVTNSKGQSTGQEVKITSMGGEINVDDAPAGADVTTMGGDIEIRSAARFVNAKTMGGDIHVGAVDGGIKATTMGGDVSVTMVGNPDEGQRDVTLTSMGGDITLTVPAGLSMDIYIEVARTRNSGKTPEIVSDFPVQLRETEDWKTEYGTPRKITYGTGQVGGGRNKITIKTINGDVHLKRG
jgi:hypothetical protein